MYMLESGYIKLYIQIMALVHLLIYISINGKKLIEITWTCSIIHKYVGHTTERYILKMNLDQITKHQSHTTWPIMILYWNTYSTFFFLDIVTKLNYDGRWVNMLAQSVTLASVRRAFLLHVLSCFLLVILSHHA